MRVLSHTHRFLLARIRTFVIFRIGHLAVRLELFPVSTALPPPEALPGNRPHLHRYGLRRDGFATGSVCDTARSSNGVSELRGKKIEVPCQEGKKQYRPTSAVEETWTI